MAVALCCAPTLDRWGGQIRAICRVAPGDQPLTMQHSVPAYRLLFFFFFFFFFFCFGCAPALGAFALFESSFLQMFILVVFLTWA